MSLRYGLNDDEDFNSGEEKDAPKNGGTIHLKKGNPMIKEK